jgi:hypothetical protein
MARMRIPSSNEQDTFDKPPLFDHKERKQFLTLPKGLMDIAKGIRTPDGQIGFLLMCGYFKATKRFYPPQDFQARDLTAAAHQLNLPEQMFEPPRYRNSAPEKGSVKSVQKRGAQK